MFVFFDNFIFFFNGYIIYFGEIVNVFEVSDFIYGLFWFVIVLELKFFVEFYLNMFGVVKIVLVFEFFGFCC